MDSDRKDVFDKYLALGGISAGPKQFSGGLDANAMSDMSAADIALMKATHFVDIDKYGGEQAYEVDFVACAKAFFSSRVPQLYYLSSANSVKDVKAKTDIIRNFLKYLLHHDVCPEYKSQVIAACDICNLTDQELPKTMKAQSYFPGDFQTACSEIFGGIYQGKYAKNPHWAPDAESYAGMSPEDAHRTFKIGLAAQASDEVTKRYREQNAAGNLETLKEVLREAPGGKRAQCTWAIESKVLGSAVQTLQRPHRGGKTRRNKVSNGALRVPRGGLCAG
ncbi:MAG: hypothetical protein Q9198_011013 [Flavoplaca austrocitrina]